MLVIATPDTFNVRQMIKTARALNPEIEAIVRTHSEEEAMLLKQEAKGKVFFVEEQLADGMSRHLLERLKLRDFFAPSRQRPLAADRPSGSP